MLSRQSEKEIKAFILQSKAPLYLGIYDGQPDEYGEGADEISYAGYSRQLIEFTGTMSDAPAGNSNTVEIPRPPEGFSARAITHVGIYDAKTGGSLVLFGVLRRNGQPAPYPLGHDSTFHIGANGVQFDLVNVADAASCNG